MATARVHFEQVYFKFEEARQCVETIQAELPLNEVDFPTIRMGGDWSRHQGLDDWYVDVPLANDTTHLHLDNIIGGLPYAQGITVTAG